MRGRVHGPSAKTPVRTTVGGLPTGRCEHYYLLNNCPYCRIEQLKAQLALGGVVVEQRVDDAETAALLEQAEDAEDRARILTNELDTRTQERDTAQRRAGQLQRALNEMREGGVTRREMTRLRARIAALEEQPRDRLHDAASSAEIERLRTALNAARAELARTRDLLSERWGARSV